MYPGPVCREVADGPVLPPGDAGAVDAVRVACVGSGHLVNSPHRAWQDAWSEKAQRVHDRPRPLADLAVVTAVTTPGDGG